MPCIPLGHAANAEKCIAVNLGFCAFYPVRIAFLTKHA